MINDEIDDERRYMPRVTRYAKKDVDMARGAKA